MHPHLLRFSELEPQNASEAGFRLIATKKNFPVLQGMSIYKLVLQAGGVREPHWHANADELGYVVTGKVLVSFYADGNCRESFVAEKGEAFFIPSGALHAIENLGEERSELILQFSHEEPEDFELATSVNMFTDAVLGNTWGKKGSYFQTLKRPIEAKVIGRTQKREVSRDSSYASSYRFSLKASSPSIANEGGAARVARHNVWQALKRQALYLLDLTGTGMREPHWHPETAELGYVTSGKGRMSILSPNGAVDTYEMVEGDVYFIPKAYPHHIENLGTTPLQILVFFDQPMPQDIGFTASVKSFSNELLASSLNCPKPLVEGLPTYFSDLFIVHKEN